MAIWYKKLWFTDRVDVYRTVEKSDGVLSTRQWKLIYEGIPCRRYTKGAQGLQLTDNTGQILESGRLMVEKDVDIVPGDQLVLHSDGIDTMFYAGTVNNYYIPYHGRKPPLDHKEVDLQSDIKRALGVEHNRPVSL
jgi:hypothetical protein